MIYQVAVEFFDGIRAQSLSLSPFPPFSQHRLKRSGARTDVSDVLNFDAAKTYLKRRPRNFITAWSRRSISLRMSFMFLHSLGVKLFIASMCVALRWIYVDINNRVVGMFEIRF